MTLFARPTDAELLARLESKKAPAPASNRKCEFCRTPMLSTDTSCQRCFREPLEKSEQAEVVKLYRAFGCHVYNLSQARASKQTPGLPDLWVARMAGDYLGRCWWHETKRPVSGKPSSPQKIFAGECQAAGALYVIGGLVAAREMLVEIGAARYVEGGDIEPSRA